MSDKKIMVRICKDCGTVYGASKKRCETCGTRLSEPMENEKAVDMSRELLREKAEIQEVIEDSRMSDGRNLDGIVPKTRGNGCSVSNASQGVIILAWIVFFMFFRVIFTRLGCYNAVNYVQDSKAAIIAIVSFVIIIIFAALGEHLAEKNYNKKTKEMLMVRVCKDCGVVYSASKKRCESCGTRLGEPVQSKKAGKSAADKSSQPTVSSSAEDPQFEHQERFTDSFRILPHRKAAGTFALLSTLTTVSILIFNYLGYCSFDALNPEYGSWLRVGAVFTAIIGFITAIRSFRFDPMLFISDKKPSDSLKIIGAVISVAYAAFLTILALMAQ